MHECFADPEAMRFWNAPVHTKRTRPSAPCSDMSPAPRPTIGTGRSPTLRLTAASASSAITMAISATSVRPSAISSTPHIRAGAWPPRLSRRCSTSVSTISACTVCRRSSIPTTPRRANWSRNSDSGAKAYCVIICVSAASGAMRSCMRSLGLVAHPAQRFQLSSLSVHCDDARRAARQGPAGQSGQA